MIVEITVAKDGEGKILTLTAANLQDIKTLEEIFQTGHYLHVNRGQKKYTLLELIIPLTELHSYK